MPDKTDEINSGSYEPTNYQKLRKFLETLASKDSSTDKESEAMQELLRLTGFKKAIVTLGIVYLEGRGTIEAPPRSIHTFAKAFIEQLDAVNKAISE